MDERPSDFRDTLLELIESSPAPADHPSPDRWLAYQRGELAADEEAQLQEHLARCRDCFDLAAAAASFAEREAEPGAGGDVETAALWRLLRPQLGARDNVRAISAGPRRQSWRFRLPSYLAASFFVALMGMTAWNLHTRQPLPNAPIFDIYSGDRDPNRREWTMPAGPRMLVFHAEEELPVYRLVIRDAAAGRELYSYELRPNQDRAMTLYLPAGLPPGRYRMEIADGSGGRAGRVLATHRVRVAEPGRGD